MAAEEASNETDESLVDEWTTHDSGMMVDPEIMLLTHKDLPVVRTLWSVLRDENTPAAQIVHDLKDMMDVLLMDEQDNDERRKELLKKLPEGFFDSSDETRAALVHAREAIFHTNVKYKVHSKFGQDCLVMLDLSFLPQDFFFSDDDHDLLSNIYWNFREPSKKKHKKLHVTTIRKTLGFYDLGQGKSDKFQFHGPAKHTIFFKNVLKHFLVKHGGMPEESDFSWLLGFLYTHVENVQDAHIDYEHSSLKRFREDWRNRHVSHLLPWSMDLPLGSGGLRLKFYGPDGDLQEPCILQVPARHVLLWRGDCLHAGGLLDLNGEEGFRMHAYLNLVKQHEHLTNSTLKKIEWFDDEGVRYMKYCESWPKVDQ